MMFEKPRNAILRRERSIQWVREPVAQRRPSVAP